MQPTEDNAGSTIQDQSILDNAIANQRPTNLAELGDQIFDEKAREDEQKEDSKEELAEDKEEVKEDVKEASEETGAEEAEAESDDDEGYYADEGLDDGEDYEPVQPTQQTPTTTNDMGQWILENLPSIQVVGERNGKVVNLEVKRAEDLPRDFQFASEYDRQIFQQNIADQTTRAYRLAEQWNNNQQASEAQRFSQQEDRDIQTDIADLQREGELSKFKHSPTDRRFNDDPAVQETQEVLDFYNNENQRRFEESQRNGRLFNRISFKDAYYLYRRVNPKDSPEQKQRDNVRKAQSRKTANTPRGEEQKETRPRLPRNASLEQIMAAYNIE